MAHEVRIEGLDVVLGNLVKYGAEQRAALREAGLEISELLANYAKTNHAWKPVTGATDVSTHGAIAEETGEYVLVALSAGMDYDVFLELAREGRWSWLWPAVVACKPQILAIMTRHLSR